MTIRFLLVMFILNIPIINCHGEETNNLKSITWSEHCEFWKIKLLAFVPTNTDRYARSIIISAFNINCAITIYQQSQSRSDVKRWKIDYRSIDRRAGLSRTSNSSNETYLIKKISLDIPDSYGDKCWEIISRGVSKANRTQSGKNTVLDEAEYIFSVKDVGKAEMHAKLLSPSFGIGFRLANLCYALQLFCESNGDVNLLRSEWEKAEKSSDNRNLSTEEPPPTHPKTSQGQTFVAPSEAQVKQ